MSFSDKLVISVIIVAVAAVTFFAYLHLSAKNYDAVRSGMSPNEVITTVGQPELKTKQGDMTVWFYGVRNKQAHEGAFGMSQYSLNAELAIVLNTDETHVVEIDRSVDKQWVVSIPSAAAQPPAK